MNVLRKLRLLYKIHASRKIHYDIGDLAKRTYACRRCVDCVHGKYVDWDCPNNGWCSNEIGVRVKYECYKNKELKNDC